MGCFCPGKAALQSREDRRVRGPFAGPAFAAPGGSAYFGAEDDYINADAFWRFYPQGTPLDGWMLGVKAGVTSVGDEGTFFGAGFDVNRSWIMGKNDNLYLGIGFCLKRMYVSSDPSFDLK